MFSKGFMYLTVCLPPDMQILHVIVHSVGIITSGLWTEAEYVYVMFLSAIIKSMKGFALRKLDICAIVLFPKRNFANLLMTYGDIDLSQYWPIINDLLSHSPQGNFP